MLFRSNPGYMRISVTASPRYSTEVEEDRVTLGTTLMDTASRSVEKAESDVAILGTSLKRAEPELFVRRVEAKAGCERPKGMARLVSGSRKGRVRERQHSEESSSTKWGGGGDGVGK